MEKSDNAAPPLTPEPVGSLSFLKGSSEYLTQKEGGALTWDQAILRASPQLSEALSARHVGFLLGSGASSLTRNGNQVGIPTMGPLAKEFCETIGGRGDKRLLTKSERKVLKIRFGIDIASSPYGSNLEKLLDVLFSLRLVLSQSVRSSDKSGLGVVERCISKVKGYLLHKCTEGPFSPLIGDTQLIDLYKKFYRKLAFRDRSLPRPWVFTTNYDLFNETAMDQLGLSYCNGFSGTIERRFNPAIYRYALAEQLDIAERRWTAVDGFVYLCKLHGSVSWIEDSHGLYPIRELQEPKDADRVMIYPAPTKQNASFGSPYSDLFREFQSRVAREQSVIFTIGYRFSDEHVNNILYQALTIPTFRLVIFGSPESSPEIKRLRDLDDPRIWIIHGKHPDGRMAHYFDNVVEALLPAEPIDRVDAAVAKVIEKLIQPSLNAGSQSS